MIKSLYSYFYLCVLLAPFLLMGCREERLLPDNTVPKKGIILNFNTATRAAGGADSWEDTITRATVFIFRSSDLSLNAAPVIKYLFSAQDVVDNKAMIPMEVDFLAGQDIDVYTVVNSRDAIVNAGNKPLTRGDLLALVDSSAAARYNSSSYVDMWRSISSGGGFTMSGHTKAKVEVAGSEPQQIPISVRRTLSRLDVDVVTDSRAFRKYVTEKLNEPNATLKISAAWILRGNRKVPVFETGEHVVDDYLAPYTRADSLVQGNDYFSDELYFGRFRFYLFQTDARGAIIYPFWFDETNQAIKLRVRAIYDPDGNIATENQKMIYYSVPVQVGPSTTEAGAIERNTRYRVDLIVVGINDTQISQPAEASSRTQDGTSVVRYIVGGEER